MRSTAQNSEDIGKFLGDPTRWGSTVSWDVPIIGGADTGYSVGPDAVLMQFSDLRSRCVDVFCKYNIEGILDNDGAFAIDATGYTGFGLRWTIGGGQSSTQADSAAVYSPAETTLGGPFPAGFLWSRGIVNKHITEGVMQTMSPVPLTSLVIRPVFRLKSSDEPNHIIRITATVIAAPRA